MASKANTLLCLPPEILIRILSSEVLQDVDVCNASQACESLSQICCCNEIWKAKFQRRWQSGLSTDKASLPPGGWLELFKIRKTIFQQVQKLVKTLAAKNYHREEVSNESFHDFLQLGELHERGLAFVLEDLHDILECDRYKRLTDKYYSKKAVYFLNHRRLEEEWTSFLGLSQEQQSMEKGAVMVSDWMRPLKRVSLSDVSRQLDDIADQVRAALKLKSTDHPACFKDNSHTGFVENLWTVDQCREVLLTLNSVLYEQLGFKGNHANYYLPENSFIDEVLEQKKGIPITMSIVYASVARRLGVVLEAVNFPKHFLLRWKEHPMATGVDQYTFVDAFNNGKFHSHKSCRSELLDFSDVFDEDIFYPTTLAKLFERSARNLVSIARAFADSDDHIRLLRDGVALYLAISPHDRDMKMLQTRIFIHLRINLKDVIEYLQTLPPREGIPSLIHECEKQLLMNQTPPEEPTPKHRADFPMVKFSVGMVMKHKRYDYMCVIYGWDFECQASSEWILQMGVNRLENKHRQPFYNVLVPDGSNRYAAEENLLYTRDVCTIGHAEVGKFFEEYTGRHYIPNPYKAKEYPDDTPVTKTLIDNFFTSGE